MDYSRVKAGKIPPKTRNILARGLITSRLSYLLGIWGGATENLIKKAQTIQNSAARWVTSSHRRTRISTLLERTGWMSIQEMTKIHTSTILWKAINLRTPSNLHEQIVLDPTNGKIILQEARLQFTSNKFSIRASENWNNLPQHLRENMSLGSFKKNIKIWLKEQRVRPPDPP